jgi:glycosyltransferase involved in cell wall biosynthesis
MYSLVTPNRDRLEHLRQTLPSWQESATISEIVVVDFGSAVPIRLGDFDRPDKLRIVRVENTDRWRIGMAINVGVDLARCDYICKFDSDIAIVDEKRLAGLDLTTSFFRGDHRRAVSNGQVVFHRSHWQRIGGYNEWLSGYGFDDMDFYIRLRRSGVAERFLDAGMLKEITHSHTIRAGAANLSDDFFSINIANSEIAIDFQNKRNTCLSYLKRWAPEHRTKYQLTPRDVAHVDVHIPAFPDEYRTLTAFANFLGLCFFKADQKTVEALEGLIRKLITEDVSTDRSGAETVAQPARSVRRPM